MITHIRMRNFKSWEDSGEVTLAPLTGFFGTNSSGKSSLLQMLLLLKQTVEHSDSAEVIFFGDENSPVTLGNLREVIHGHDVEATLELEVGCRTQTSLIIEVGELNNYAHSGFSPLDVDSFTFSAAIQERNEQSIFEDAYYIFGPHNEWKKEWKYSGLVSPSRDQSNVLLKGDYDGSGPRIEDLLKHLSSSFENLFDHIYSLGPTRVQPKRSYHWNDKDPADVGLWGDKVIDALLCAHMRRVKISKKGEEATIEDRISEWLRELDLAYSFSLKPVGALKDDNYEVRIQKSATSPVVTLDDMGYGLADVLPMLVLCYYTPKGSTLILEQPGIHLHPMAQADLADLLIEVITERNLQILIESHSEHLLNRLQRRVAEEKIAADQTALYFCRYIDGASKIDRLEMDEFGNIANWPENFFGDEMGDLFAMTEAQRERQKRTEG
ncbi:DUF3696 domain-containing protein [Candidatus Poribacteria bacterium]|nr:DUF3696 domain-containing protein [Candidatus Poribacteria bacterium]MYK24241.1 DUF3696 domain-containing protein [Candidatus Poribacteria bacterium]